LALEKFFVIPVKNEGIKQSRLPVVSLNWRKGVTLVGFSNYLRS